MNHLHIGTSCILQLGSYHWHRGTKIEPFGTPHEIFENFETPLATSEVKWHSAK